jgi:hypothetical protein
VNEDMMFKLEQAIIQDGILKSRESYEKLEPEEYCHYCFKPVPGLRLFCNEGCSRSFEQNKKLRF